MAIASETSYVKKGEATEGGGGVLWACLRDMGRSFHNDPLIIIPAKLICDLIFDPKPTGPSSPSVSWDSLTGGCWHVPAGGPHAPFGNCQGEVRR